MARAASVVGLAVGLAAAAAVASSARPSDGDRAGAAALEPIAAELDARLREAAAGARSRAQTIADLPRLAVAVATDAATVMDLTADELAFRPRPGETIEIAQLPSGGAPASLLRIPAGASARPPLADAGEHLIKDGGALRVAEVVRFRPRERADELAGVVAVTWRVDLAQVAALLAPLGGGGRLETPAGAVDLGGGVPAGAATASVPVGAGPGRDGVRLVAPAPAAGGGWSIARLGIAGLLALGGAAAAAGFARRGAAAAASGERGLPVVARPPPRTSAPPPDGERLGRYQLLELLGSGGMADVFLARVEGEAGFARLVALKVLHDDLGRNAKFVDHFLDEARLATRLNHPNIVAITDLGKADDKYVIAMEYVDGADLERLVLGVMARGAAIPVGVALAITRRICDGLHHAHAAVGEDGAPLDLVHRDVKSANVFVARTGAVKVGDFGIAKTAGPARSAKTEIGEIKGTPGYMAPEHRLGEAIDARADVYAVGAIAYELLTGKQIDLDLARLAHLGRAGWPHLPTPSAERPELPPELDAVVFRAMAYDRGERYPTCEALEQAIGEVAERRGLVASDKAIAAWLAAELAA